MYLKVIQDNDSLFWDNIYLIGLSPAEANGQGDGQGNGEEDRQVFRHEREKTVTWTLERKNDGEKELEINIKHLKGKIKELESQKEKCTWENAEAKRSKCLKEKTGMKKRE